MWIRVKRFYHKLIKLLLTLLCVYVTLKLMNSQRALNSLLNTQRYLMSFLNYNATALNYNATALNYTKANVSATITCPTQIPKILHLTFENEMVYGNYKPLIRNCLALNPDWQVYLWRDTDSSQFIRENYPSFAAKFDSYNGDLQKSDAARYAILHRIGGVYLDMDIECRRPLFPGLQRLKVFVDRERWEQSVLLFDRRLSLMNSAMGGVPGHPFFLYVLNRLGNFNGHYPVDSTGPGALTKIYADWVTTKEAKAAPEVTVLSSEVFSGQVDPGNPAIRTKCHGISAEFKNPSPDFRKKLVEELVNFQPDQMTDGSKTKSGRDRSWMACASLTQTDWLGPVESNATIGVHKFMHLGYRFASHMRGPKFNLLGEFSGRVCVAQRVHLPPCP